MDLVPPIFPVNPQNFYLGVSNMGSLVSNGSGLSERRGRLLLWLAVAVGAMLRLAFLTAEGFWFDEFCIWRQMQMSPGEMMRDLVYEDVHPPLYQALMLGWVWLVGSSGEIALRIPSVVFGVLCIPVVYALAQRLLNNRLVSVGAAWWVALGNFGVYYGQEARSYSLLCLLSGCAALTYLNMRAQERPSAREVGLYVGSAVLLSYTHVFGMLFVAYLGLTDFVQLGRKRLSWGAFLKSQLWVVGLVGLWLPWMWIQVTRVQKGFWIPKPDFLFWFDYLGRYAGHVVLFLVWAAAVGVGVYDSVKRKDRREVLLAAWVFGWIVFVLGVPFVLSRIGQPILHDKSAIGVLMAMGVLFGWGLRGVHQQWARTVLGVRVWGVGLGLWALGSVGSVVGNTYLAQNREGWREMTSAVEARYRPGDVVALYHPDYDYFYCYRFYLDPALGALEVMCNDPKSCEGPVDEINRRWVEAGSKGNVWLLKVRARGDWPAGLETHWRVAERTEFINGELERLERSGD